MTRPLPAGGVGDLAVTGSARFSREPVRQPASFNPDPKPEPRRVDPKAVRKARDLMRACLGCGWHDIQAHHLIHRSQGGDDVAENLVPLCALCHGALHGNPYLTHEGTRFTKENVMGSIGRFLKSDAGNDHRAYILGKLGIAKGWAFLESYGLKSPEWTA